MKVFITGATGYIGLAVGQAFARAGYEVYGLCRSEAKARLLAREEIQPVQGDLNRPETWAEAAAQATLLIHCAADLQAGMVGPDKAAIEALVALGPRGARPKTLIYTSGVWVYGATGDVPADESTPLSPITVVAWRPDHEHMVLSAGTVRGIVLRPGCVYGRAGGPAGAWFEGAYRAKDLSVVGDGRNRWAMVHVDDLAEAYLRIAQSGLSGEVFNVTDRSRHTVGEMAAAAAKAAGYRQPIRYVPLEEALKKMGPFAEALALDQHVSSWKLARRLGWQPQHGGFVDGVRTFFEAWKAAQGLGS
jgi:nucleoside-diphosphate-sugar epimerase